MNQNRNYDWYTSYRMMVSRMNGANTEQKVEWLNHMLAKDNLKPEVRAEMSQLKEKLAV